MARINFVLLAILVLCAIGLVTSQHRARSLVAQLEREQIRARTLDIEYGQLQLEQSTWAMHARVERIAAEKLRMRPTDASRTVVLNRDGLGGTLLTQAPKGATAPVTALPTTGVRR